MWTGSTEYVAELFADLDWRLNMTYGYKGSGAYVQKDVMNQYGLTFDEGGLNSKTVEQNLEKSLPVIITSYQNKVTSGWWFWKKTGHANGHTWVIDGLLERTTSTRKNYRWCLVEVVEQNDDSYPLLDENGKTVKMYAKTITDKPILFEEAPEYYYTSLSDVYRDFDYVMTYERATQEGKKPCQEETITTKQSSRKFLMNWGWDGSGDNNEYELSATEWKVGNANYWYDTSIFYNLRVK